MTIILDDFIGNVMDETAHRERERLYKAFLSRWDIHCISALENKHHKLSYEEAYHLFWVMDFSIKTMKRGDPVPMLYIRNWIEDSDITIDFRAKENYETVSKVKNWKNQVPRYKNFWKKTNNNLGHSWRKNANIRKSLYTNKRRKSQREGREAAG